VYKAWNQVIPNNGMLVQYTGTITTPQWVVNTSPLNPNLAVVGFSGSGAGGAGGSGGAGYKPATMLCPSSPLTQAITVTYGKSPEFTAQIVTPTYAGIAGAVARQRDFSVQTNGQTVGGLVLGLPPGVPPNPFPSSTDNRVCELRTVPRTGSPPFATPGHVGGGGVFVPNKAIGFAGIPDGASTTICIGEQGAFQWPIETGGTADGNGMVIGIQTDLRASAPYGAFAGAAGSATTPDGKSGFNTGGAFNITTVRYPINAYTNRKWNQTLAATNPQIPQPNSANGVGIGCANNPIQSQHPSGAMVLLCDGSAQFLRNELDLPLLKRLCIRDDKLIATIP
jgi:hypothetical protein